MDQRRDWYYNSMTPEYLGGSSFNSDTANRIFVPKPPMERTNEQWKSREVARLLALVETERRYYQEMVANLPISVAVINQQGNLVAANRAFRQSFEGHGGDVRTRLIEQIFPSAELQARIQSVFESGVGSRPLVIERTVPAGGDPQRFRISVQAICDWDEDSGIQALLVVEDMADSQEREELLPGVEPPPTVAVPVPTLPVFPDALPCVIWVAHAADRTFTQVSPSSKTMLDIDPDEWIHTPGSFAGRIDPADRTRTLAFYDQALTAPGLHSCEFRMRRPGAWYRETVLVGNAGSDSITGVITEITARRRMEEHILQNQRFDAISQFAGRLAHDVNNPLMIVNGYAEDLAAAFPSGDPRAADMREIQLAGKRIGELTAHLQSVTRKQAVHTVPVEINAELAKVVERMRAAAGDYLQAEHTPAEGPLYAMAEASQFEAILLELSAALVEGGGENAQLMLSAHPYRVTEGVRADQPLSTGDFVEIAIVNQSHAGPHLPARMFESLLPGKEPGREPGPALARAYKTIQDWGGAILTLPDDDRIRVYLKAVPAPPPDQPETAPVVPTAPYAAPSAIQFARKTNVLIVEDEPGIRALMRKILQREGFDVFEAGDGTEALDIVKEKGPFDLLITDVVMPGMSGLELATQVQVMDAYCGILYMSGFTADTGVETGQFPPGSHFLQKPFTLGSLLRKANEVLASRPRRPAQ